MAFRAKATASRVERMMVWCILALNPDVLRDIVHRFVG